MGWGSTEAYIKCCSWAVVVAQLVKQSALIPEVRSSNPVIGNNLYCTFTVNCIEKTKIKKKRPGMAHLKKVGLLQVS